MAGHEKKTLSIRESDKDGGLSSGDQSQSTSKSGGRLVQGES